MSNQVDKNAQPKPMTVEESWEFLEKMGKTVHMLPKAAQDAIHALGDIMHKAGMAYQHVVGNGKPTQAPNPGRKEATHKAAKEGRS